MKGAEAALVSWINGTKKGAMADLWTIVLQSGTVLRWTDIDVDFTTVPAPPADPTPRVFTRGPVIRRDRVRWTRGIEVSQLTVDFSNPEQVVDGQLLPVFASLGGFDLAVVHLEHGYIDDAGVGRGQILWFSGTVSDVEPTDMGANIVLKSQLTQLSQQVPRGLYQAGCLNNLYDSNCAVNKAALTVSTTVLAVVNQTSFTSSGVSAPGSGYYDLGIVTFTSGANAGIRRTVLLHTTTTLKFSRPFPFAVAPGDTFTIVPGCNKTSTTCNSKFSNLSRFRGFPFVPVPETVT